MTNGARVVRGNAVSPRRWGGVPGRARSPDVPQSPWAVRAKDCAAQPCLTVASAASERSEAKSAARRVRQR